MIALGHILTLGFWGILGAATAYAYRTSDTARGTRDCRFCKGIGCEHCAGSGWVDDREMRAGVGR